MKFSILSSVLLAVSVAAAPSKSLIQIRSVDFNFETTKVRGVNLGGWLVLEPWITPSLWSTWNSNPAAGPVDEYTWCRYWGKGGCKERLKVHWANWITEADFAQIRNAGLNTVRIPIGYWAFTINPGDPYVNGQVSYLDKAIVWARKYGLKVWIDLHGAPGSQNGFDNSGLRKDPSQVGFLKGSTAAQMVAVLDKVAKKYGLPQYRDTVVAIEILNEPLGPNLNFNQLRDFTTTAYKTIRNSSTGWIVFSDAFLPLANWNGVGSKAYKGVVDKHRYQVFSEGEVARNYGQHYDSACSARWEFTGSNKYVVVGEWSGAMTDCARWLNGFARGARYEGRWQSSRSYGSCNNWGNLDAMSGDQRYQLRRFIEAQIDSYETTNGWIFWTWKTQDGNHSDDWNMSKLLRYGVFPNPVSSWKKAC